MFDRDGPPAHRNPGVILAACLAVALPAAGDAASRPVSLAMYVRLDQVGADMQATGHGRVGDVDRIRLTYDADAVDPVTRHVRLSGFQHLMAGKGKPPQPESAAVPVDDAWLDLSHAPYRLHFKASVVHGESIVIEVDELTRRLTIHRPNDATAVLLSGPYWIDSIPERLK